MVIVQADKSIFDQIRVVEREIWRRKPNANRRYSEPDATNEEGKIAEWAIGQWIGKPIEIKYEYLARGDGGIDGYLPDGRSYDSKAVWRSHRDLPEMLGFKHHDLFIANVAILSIVDRESFTIRIMKYVTRDEYLAGCHLRGEGWRMRDDFLASDLIGHRRFPLDPRFGDCCLMDQERMHDVHLLDRATARCSEVLPLRLGRQELTLAEANNQTPNFPPNPYLLQYLDDMRKQHEAIKTAHYQRTGEFPQ